MAKLEKIDFWVWQDPGTGTWCYRSADFMFPHGQMDAVTGVGRTDDAAKNAARYELRQFSYGSRLVKHQEGVL
jgi:hypothetical protein